MKTILFLFFVMATLGYIAYGQTPSNVELKEAVNVELLMNGVGRGRVSLDRGSSFPVKEIEGDKISLIYSNKYFIIPTAKTDYLEQVKCEKINNELKRQKEKEGEEKETLEAEKKRAEELKDLPKANYEQLKKNLPRLKQNIIYSIDEDIAFYKKYHQLREKFIEDYESGDAQGKVDAYNSYEAKSILMLERKQVLGYKYNELLKEEVTTPIDFNLFSNSDSFYITVGEGGFSTLAILAPRDALNLIRQIDKIFTWQATCSDEKMDVTKDAGSFGGVSLRFVSQSNGNHVFVWFTAKGTMTSDHLIDKQVVKLNTINLFALKLKLQKLPDLVDKRNQNRKNAEKLK